MNRFTAELQWRFALGVWYGQRLQMVGDKKGNRRFHDRRDRSLLHWDPYRSRYRISSALVVHSLDLTLQKQCEESLIFISDCPAFILEINRLHSYEKSRRLKLA